MSTDRSPSRAVLTTVAVVQLLAVGLWASGLLTLGAGGGADRVPRRARAGQRRCDDPGVRPLRRHRITCAAIALVAEAAFAVRGGRVTRADIVRGASLVFAAGLAIAIGAWLSPGIAQLHRDGAMRGVGEGGLALERLHRLAREPGEGAAAPPSRRLHPDGGEGDSPPHRRHGACTTGLRNAQLSAGCLLRPGSSVRGDADHRVRKLTVRKRHVIPRLPKPQSLDGTETGR